MPKSSELREGHVTEKIEEVSARTPSLVYLGLAGAAIAGSLALFATGKREAGIFVGLWPIAFMLMGNYNKLVKLGGSSGY